MASVKQSRWFSSKSLKLLPLPFLRRRGNATPVTTPPGAPARPKGLDSFREVFRHLDADGDGRISSDELRAFFSSLGEEMSADEAEGAISDVDTDGDGMLDFEEFMSLMEEEEDEVEEGLREAFEMFEAVKGSGRITPGGVQRMLRRLGDERTYGECEAMVRAYDLDGNGELSFHEFHRMMS